MTDEMLMIRPERCLRKPRVSAWVKRKAPFKIGVQYGVPIRLAHAHEQPIAGHAGVVDQNIDLAGVLQNLLGGGGNRGGIRHIHGVGPSLPAQGANFRGDFFGIFGRARNAGDVRAFGGKFQGDGAANAASGAGDNGGLIDKLRHSLLPR